MAVAVLGAGAGAAVATGGAGWALASSAALMDCWAVRRTSAADAGLSHVSFAGACRGTTLIRNSLPLGPYSRTMPMVLWWS